MNFTSADSVVHMKRDDATIPVETVRRPNETLAILPKKGKITVVMRRLFISMLYHAQRQGNKLEYQLPLAEILRSAQFHSRNTTDLKAQLRALRSTEVEWNVSSEKQNEWGISGMVKEIRIIERPGHPSMLIWELPGKVREQLHDPDSYTALKLQIYSSLRTGAASALYGICSRYATNPTRLTMREAWEWWRPRLTGNSETESYREYKFFKRDVLKPAIADIAAIADISVELIEIKNGKRIEQLQFRVTRKSTQSDLLLSSIDGNLLGTVVELGIPEAEARRICESHAEAFIRKTVALTAQRAADTTVSVLKSKPAYFRSAIKGRYAETAPADKTAAVSAKKEKTSQESPVVEKQREMATIEAARHLKAFDHYKNMDPEAQAALVEKFRQHTTVAHYQSEIRKRGIASPVVRSAFCAWHADTVLGPSD